jgi:hypothetical protein
VTEILFTFIFLSYYLIYRDISLRLFMIFRNRAPSLFLRRRVFSPLSVSKLRNHTLSIVGVKIFAGTFHVWCVSVLWDSRTRPIVVTRDIFEVPMERTS